MSASLDRSPLWTPLLALDRLNSCLRSDRAPLHALKRAIYWTKTQAILDASKRWHIGMRRVMVKKPCRRCDATGIWLPWNWEPEDGDYRNRDGGEVCRGCHGAGTATLLFIETSIGPLRWHTPAEKWHMSSLDVYVPFPSFYGEGDAEAEKYYEPADGWEPCRSGRPLTPKEARRDTLLVLAGFPHDLCFAIDFDYHAGLERMYRHPDLDKAADWINCFFDRNGMVECD